MITKLEGSWFKGLRKISLVPKNINLLIGANGTGKTNFADFIEFLSSTFRFGLKETIDNMGGLEAVRTNLPLGRPPILGCHITLGQDFGRGIEEVSYKFALSYSKSLIVESEQLHARVYPQPVFNTRESKADPTKSIEIGFERKKNKILKWVGRRFEEFSEIFEDEQNLVLNAYGRLSNFRRVAQYFSSMRVYNIDAALIKRAAGGSAYDLERTGANLIFFLKRFLEDDKLKDKMMIHLRDVVPYIKEIEIQRILNYTTLKFSEFDSKMDFRAEQMSDGTIRLLGLLAVLLRHSPLPVVVIEEPENALHSYAIKTLIEIAKEASLAEKSPTQIFLTSHSPMVVDSVLSIESQREVPTQCYVTRRKDGSSTIEPVSDKLISGIVKNLGRPSDFLRDGLFEDQPTQIEISYPEGENNDDISR